MANIKQYRVLLREDVVKYEAQFEGNDAQSVVEFLKRQGFHLTNQEQFAVLFLNSKNKIFGMQIASVGTATAAHAHPREVFTAALLNGAVGVIVVHNHPSGDTTPSPADVQVTKKLISSGEILSVPVLDHLIVAPNGNWVSLRAEDVCTFC